MYPQSTYTSGWDEKKWTEHTRTVDKGCGPGLFICNHTIITALTRIHRATNPINKPLNALPSPHRSVMSVYT